MSQEGFGKRLVPSLGHALQKGRACQWPASPCPSPACAVTADPGHSQRSEAEKKCIEKMLSLGADITLITDNAKFDEYKDKANVYTFAPVGDEFECMFAFALFAQMLACKISCASSLQSALIVSSERSFISPSRPSRL